MVRFPAFILPWLLLDRDKVTSKTKNKKRNSKQSRFKTCTGLNDIEKTIRQSENKQNKNAE
jgi:hypothetical protein